MKKSHILKKKEARMWKRIGPVTEENMEDYPIGNPFKKTAKKEIEEMGTFIKKYREEHPMSDEDKQKMLDLQQKYIVEDRISEEKRKRLRIRRIFIKS